MIYSHIKQDTYFRVGLLLKIAAILFFEPIIQENWFIPFIINFIEDPSINPWGSYSLAGGDPTSFPYGITMLVVHLPTMLIGWMADTAIGTDYFASLGFRISLLIADIVCLVTICELTRANYKTLIKLYWLSPVVFLIIYWHGQTDIIPVSLLFLGALLAFEGKLIKSAIFLAVAFVSKHSAAIAIPFILLYLVLNKRGSKIDVVKYLIALAVSILLLEGGYVFSRYYQEMVLFNPEVGKLFWLTLNMGNDLAIPITPAIFTAFLYLVWRLKRCNSQLIIMAAGVGVNIVLLTVPSQPGWFLWMVPILAIYAATNKKTSNILTWAWATTFSIYHFLYSEGSKVLDVAWAPLTTVFPILNESELQTYLYTTHFILLILLTIQLVRDGVFANDYFKLSKRPLVIGIGGDSGSGKTTMSRILADVLGYGSVAKISGDNYHRWDRDSPLWKSYTHLSPDANYISRMENDAAKMARYKSVYAQTYDHNSGRFTPLKIVKNKEILLIEGLHSLYSKSLCNLLDVKIFLNMDENLKKNYKIKRDTEKRGQGIEEVISKIKQRKPDYERYIVPQAKNASLIFGLHPLTKLEDNDSKIGRHKLQVYIKNSMYCEYLTPTLVGLVGLQVDEYITDEGWVCIEIEGDIYGDDIALLVETLIPEMEALLCHNPVYRDGMEGVMQLIALIEIDTHFKQRS